jgi:hypothetical protein
MFNYAAHFITPNFQGQGYYKLVRVQGIKKTLVRVRLNDPYLLCQSTVSEVATMRFGSPRTLSTTAAISCIFTNDISLKLGSANALLIVFGVINVQFQTDFFSKSQKGLFTRLFWLYCTYPGQVKLAWEFSFQV